MNITMLKSKIHRAVVTQAELNYVGSITVDSELLKEAGILEYEMVQIVDIENGNRFETYTIAAAYWYVKVVDLLDYEAKIPSEAFVYMGIELLFSAAIITIAIVIDRARNHRLVA